MPIHFKKSSAPTIGVEVEVQLINPGTLDLKPAALTLLREAASIKDLHLRAELTQAMVEINSGPHKTVAEAEADLKHQLLLLKNLSKKTGTEIAVSGTHPFQNWRERTIYPTVRYEQILEKFQWIARRLTMFGLHVHVGVTSGDRAIAIINSLIAYIPHLLALSASSPFWSGLDTGLASSRVAVFESLPTAGLPYYFLNWKEFENYFETLQATQTIGSIKDIYWDIRPHFDFGTIEVRICDGLPTLQETIALVALIQCLVVWIDDQLESGKLEHRIHMQHYWLAPENKWQAARYGLDGQIVVEAGMERRIIREDIARLVEILKPTAVHLQCKKELELINDILKKGPSYIRQREIFAKTNSHIKIVESLIQELEGSFT